MLITNKRVSTESFVKSVNSNIIENFDLHSGTSNLKKGVCS